LDCFIFASLGPNAVWKAHPDDVDFAPLASLPGFKVVNPLLHSKLFKIPSHWGTAEPRITGVGDQYAIIRSQYLALFTNPDAMKALARADARDKYDAFLEDELPPIAKSLTRALRYVTKQAQLPQEPSSYGMTIPANFDFTLYFPAMRKHGNTYISNYELETAITMDRVLEADKVRGSHLPVVDSLLLDSVQALLDSDYRRALLFAAIAMEAHAATTLDDLYHGILEKDQPAPHMHVVSFDLPGGATRQKDPIYVSLAERAQTDFAMLLHELPLYLFGRYILVEDQPLYQRARRLYRTRNQIVHRGEIPDRAESSFAFSVAGAQAGIETALAVCRWFGLNEHYALPGSGHVELRQADPEYGGIA
jgi:hypothetical protein